MGITLAPQSLLLRVVHTRPNMTRKVNGTRHSNRPQRIQFVRIEQHLLLYCLGFRRAFPPAETVMPNAGGYPLDFPLVRKSQFWKNGQNLLRAEHGVMRQMYCRLSAISSCPT